MANDIIKGMGFHHIGLKVADFAKSREMYRALGMKEICGWGEGDKEIVMFDLGDGGRIELFAGGGDFLSKEGKWLHFAMWSTMSMLRMRRHWRQALNPRPRRRSFLLHPGRIPCPSTLHSLSVPTAKSWNSSANSDPDL